MLHQKIKKQEQQIARLEVNLSREKLKKRKADTRRKIEFGGLVIKSGMDGLGKIFIFGALSYAMELFSKDSNYETVFKSLGETAFLNKK